MLRSETLNLDATWLAHRDFGIEASLLGLIAISILLVSLYLWNPEDEAGEDR